ncbi:hypothetical protein FOL46_003514 [Perkinsus olseni]|uniref:Phosphatidylinositol-4-phosphate 5-kinase-like protein 1 n=2 Tax=Perkinsus olseni TaxID=32597 RepID=A0A7J6M2F7_PEROL|nr:hypothetical protein FOL46_003514 [Perkinsus olseni]
MAEEEAVLYSLVTEEGETRPSAFGYTGKGTATYPNGDVYEGHFKDGMKSGDGVYTHKSGNTYEGSYEEGKKHGMGKYTMVEGGSYYHGSFARGLYNGKGTMMYGESGDVYTGEWKDGLRHGTGTYVYRRGQASITGSWKDDRIVEGTWRLSPDHNSPVFEGKFDLKFSQPIGEGVWTLPDGGRIFGKYTQSHTPSDISDDIITNLHWVSSDGACV